MGLNGRTIMMNLVTNNHKPVGHRNIPFIGSKSKSPAPDKTVGSKRSLKVT